MARRKVVHKSSSRRQNSRWFSLNPSLQRVRKSLPFYRFFSVVFILFVGFLAGLAVNQKKITTQGGERKQIIPISSHIQTCFTPQQKCLPLLLKEIDSAKKTLHIQCYAFTSKPITNLLLKKVKQGVKITILADKSNKTARFSQLPYLSYRGVDIIYEKGVRIAHNKIIIIDGKRVITGSYNFSHAAEYYNSENFIVINDKPLAQRYMNNFYQRARVLLAKKPVKKIS